MADAGAGRHDAEVVERALAPLQEVVALAVALVFELDVLRERLRRAELVDDHRVVDDEVDGDERIDLLGSPPSAFMPSRMAARSTTAGTPVKSCISTRAGRKAISLLGLALVVEPGGDCLDVFLGDRAAVLVAQQVLEQHLHGEGQPRDASKAVLLGLGQGVILVGLAIRPLACGGI